MMLKIIDKCRNAEKISFRHQGQSGTSGHGLVRYCPAIPSYVIVHGVKIFSDDIYVTLILTETFMCVAQVVLCTF